MLLHLGWSPLQIEIGDNERHRHPDGRLVRGRVYAIDGAGLGNDYRLVCLVCVSSQRPVIVAWRLLEGQASEKGKEAALTLSQ